MCVKDCVSDSARCMDRANSISRVTRIVVTPRNQTLGKREAVLNSEVKGSVLHIKQLESW